MWLAARQSEAVILLGACVLGLACDDITGGAACADGADSNARGTTAAGHQHCCPGGRLRAHHGVFVGVRGRTRAGGATQV